jgi:hypothetical protein
MPRLRGFPHRWRRHLAGGPHLQVVGAINLHTRGGLQAPCGAPSGRWCDPKQHPQTDARGSSLRRRHKQSRAAGAGNAPAARLSLARDKS